MSKFKRILVAILPYALLAAALLTGVLWGRYIEYRKVDAQLSYIVEQWRKPQFKDKISYTMAEITSKYVDSIPMDSLSEKIIPEIIKELDPHSMYIPAKDMQRVAEPLDGDFDGIGVVFNMAPDTVIVLNVIPAGPSAKAGLMGRDRIITINDSIVAGRKVPQDSIMKLLRGKRGTKVKLGIERSGLDELVQVEVVRDKIPIHSVESAFMLTDSIGFIRMSQFGTNTYSEMVKSLSNLREEGMRRLILDLRGNTGGYLDQAIMVSNEFLTANQLIVYTEDRAGNQQKQYSDGNGRFSDVGLAILIDEGSASSSEILAGAIQDNDRGVIIGRRSFGKGLVQQQIPYPDGSALRLTIARYYTPTGRSIQKPYKRGHSSEYEEDMINRYHNNEMFTTDSLHFADSLKKFTPKGKAVYGGGGIMPDIFVAADTTDVSPYYIEVQMRNILFHYTIEYSDKHTKALNAVESVAQLDSLLDADTKLVENFISYAQRKGVKPKWAEINRSRELLHAQLRAYIGRNTPIQDDGFYSNIYPVDNVLQQAVKSLHEVEDLSSIEFEWGTKNDENDE